MASRLRTPLAYLESRVRAKRVTPERPVIAQTHTIGTQMLYSLGIDNASRSGFLLDVGRYRKVPYQVNTLIEVTIDPHGATLERPVQCLGKIVRVAQDGDLRTGYGVQIIQMDTKDLAVWEKAMADLEGKDQDAEASPEVELDPAS